MNKYNKFLTRELQYEITNHIRIKYSKRTNTTSTDMRNGNEKAVKEILSVLNEIRPIIKEHVKRNLLYGEIEILEKDIHSLILATLLLKEEGELLWTEQKQDNDF